jgi:hypothetical protein
MEKNHKFDCIAFFHRVFFLQREALLFHWHAKKSKAEYARLSDEFYAFMRAILYEPVRFHMLKDYFLVFGPSLPIRYSFLTQAEDKAFMLKLFSTRKESFGVKKDYENNEFDYSNLTFIKDSELIDVPTRRALLREFVWMCCKIKEAYIFIHIVAALQRILASQEGKGDVFVAALHQAIQGRTMLKEVVCWDNSPYDTHPGI